MASSLPQPATVSVDRRRPGILHGIKARWTRFKQSRNSGSSPSYFEKDFPLGGGSTEASVSVTGAGDEPQRKRDVYYAIPKVYSSREGDEYAGRFRSNRRKTSRPQGKPSEPVENDPEEIVDVDVVVVDNSFEVGGQQESLTEPSAGPGAAEHQPTVAMQPGQGKISGGFGWDPKDKQNGLNMSSSQTHSQHDTGSVAHTGITSMYIQNIIRFFRYGYAIIYGVFFPHFDDAAHEKQFYSQEWYLGKMLALIASGFLVVNWVLACIFVPRPFVLFDYIFHFGIAPVLTLPLPVFIILRFPVRRPVFYQIFVTASLWSWTYWYGLSLILCGYYSGPSHQVFTCGNKDFLGLFYFCTGFPAIGLFALGQRRFPAAIAAGLTLTLLAIFVIPYRSPWVRQIVNQLCFHGFLIYINWSREMADRDRFVMSRQIKEAYLYRHRLQMREKQIQNSKQRLTGYIFHEVRVPLNTAMLAVQNIEASGSVTKPLELEFNALTGSLTVMSKVLNDVLDLNRMDAGKFESVNKPYVFHKVVELLLVPLRLAASAKGINLVEELDPRIDKFALNCLIAAKKSKGCYDENEELEPLVVGDEMRCRQIFTNLTSNATKFCPPGGTVTVVTKLLWPSPPGAGATPPVGPSDPEWHEIRSENVSSKTAASEHDAAHSNGQSSPPDNHPGIPNTGSNGRLSTFANLKGQEKGKHNASTDGNDDAEEYTEKPALNVPTDQVVIRIEIRDTGIGIKKKDVHDAKLFSPYVQTEIGRHQGGKGTGLGLALVRRIVKLSGGRLGVKSKFQQGSCFWVELPLGVGSRALHAQSAEGGSGDVSIRSRSMAPTRARDFAVDQSSVYTNATANNDNSARASFSLSPPAPHFSHRTIMEQQGRVEMTPSRPELRYRRETPMGAPHNEPISSKLAAIQAFTSDTQAVATQQRALDVARTDTSSSSPASLEADVATNVPATQTNEPLQALVVDDDSLTRKLMTRLLTRLGCVVTTAENGVKALEILLGPVFTPSERPTPSTLMPSTPGTSSSGIEVPASQPRFFDVVFLDNQMPLMSGLEAIARLRAAGREDLVVGVTGNALIRDQDEYLTAGVDHVLIKPVFEKSLKQMLSLAERRRTPGVDETAVANGS